MDDQTTIQLMKAAGLGPGGLAASGMMVSLFVFALNFAKSWPPKIFSWMKRVFTYSVQIDNSDSMYSNMATWLSNRPNLTKTKNFIIRSGDKGDGGNHANLVLGHGYHTFVYKGGLFVLSYAEETKDGGETNSPIVYRKFSLRIVWGGRRVLNTFLAELEQADKENNKSVKIFNHSGWHWSETSIKPKRTADTLSLGEGVIDNIIEDVQSFFDSKDWYASVGIPWRRGYLFYGEPGTGKSSLAFVLASHFDSPIFMLDLSADCTPQMMLGKIPPRSIILIEDIDTANVSRSPDKGGMSLGTLLNALDGVCAQEGSIVIMTTNYITELDSALIRPGRVDNKFYIGLADSYQLKSMFEKFYPGEDGTEFSKLVPDGYVTPASVQEHLLKYRNDYKLAIKHAIDIEVYVQKEEEEEKEEEKEEHPKSMSLTTGMIRLNI